ncbi:Fibronectin type III [Trinorchestia longiramus]|nr:Fibronectin type III [Trinorchestia longiramus]
MSHVDHYTRTEYRMGNWVYLNVSVPHDNQDLPDIAPTYQYTGPDRVLALEGDNLQLYCIYSGIPTPTVRWTMQTPTGSVELPSTESVLRVSPVTPGDEGVYVCHPHNAAGEGGTHQFTVEVEAAPVFEEGPEMVSLPMEETAKFTCKGRGDPPPAVQWTRDGSPIPGGETIEFSALTTQDKSVIACNISNIHGYSYTTAFLNVLSMPPEFEEHPQDSLVLEGDSVTLKCDAYGSPDPHITWHKLPQEEEGNGEEENGSSEDEEDTGELKDGELFEIKDDNLIIKSVTDATTGHYRCTATNKYGQVTAEATVDSRTPSSVRLTSESEAVKAGNVARLTCDVTHDPLLDVDVTWSKDNEDLDISHDDRITVSEESVQNGVLAVVLSIEASHGTDSGVYTCKAETAIDDHEDNTILMVEDVPAPPTLISLDCEEDSALLQWSSGGENNAPIISFSVEYDTDVAPGDWKEAVDELGSDRTTAQVEVWPGREYRFRVVAVNRVGQSPPGSLLNCTTPPAPPAINPHNVTLVDAGATSLVLNWEPLTEEERQGPMFQYEILWREIADDEEHLYDDEDEDAIVDGDDGLDEGVTEDEEEEWEKKVITNGDESVARVTGLLPNTRYLVKLRTANALGVSSDSVPTRTEKTAPAGELQQPGCALVLNASIRCTLE